MSAQNGLQLPRREDGAVDVHALASLPYGYAGNLIRKELDATWGRGEGGELREYKCIIKYSYTARDTFTCFVMAESEHQAEEFAEEEFDKDRSISPNADIDDILVKAPRGAA